MNSYTVILTRGTHVVDHEDGESIIAALNANERFVTVNIDMLGDGIMTAGVRISTAHVVAIIPNDAAADGGDAIRFAPQVSLLRSRRDARPR